MSDKVRVGAAMGHAHIVSQVGTFSSFTRCAYALIGKARSHADGSLAQGPIALCEVWGYVHAAIRLTSTRRNCVN
jgi:hypothetical protein